MTAAPGAPTPEMSVVICSYNRAENLAKALVTIDAQTIRDRLDVVVVDDGSTDNTAAVAARHDVRLVRHGMNRGIGAARTTGLNAATTQLVAFTDDDCRPEPTWAQELLALANRHPEAAAVGGRVAAVPTSGLVNRFLRARNALAPLELKLLADNGFAHRLREYLARSSATDEVGDERSVASLVGANMALRREVVEELGAWDARFKAGGEEEEFFRRAIHIAGHRAIYSPAPVVMHEYVGTMRDVLRRSRSYGRGNARMFVKHGGLPTLYPAPVIVGGLLLAALWRPVRIPALLLAAVAPQAIFSAGPRMALAQRDPASLLFPYMQVLQEGASNIGWIGAWLTERHLFTEPGDHRARD